MTINRMDVVIAIAGIGLSLLGDYTNSEPALWMGGLWMGVIVFKLGHLAEQKWGKG